MGFRAISIVLFSLFLVTSPVHALSVVGPDNWAQVVYDAELIIVGFPIDSGTSHRVGNSFIVTDWQVFPQYVLLGSTSYEPLTVRTAEAPSTASLSTACPAPGRHALLVAPAFVRRRTSAR